MNHCSVTQDYPRPCLPGHILSSQTHKPSPSRPFKFPTAPTHPPTFSLVFLPISRLFTANCQPLSPRFTSISHALTKDPSTVKQQQSLSLSLFPQSLTSSRPFPPRLRATPHEIAKMKSVTAIVSTLTLLGAVMAQAPSDLPQCGVSDLIAFPPPTPTSIASRPSSFCVHVS